MAGVINNNICYMRLCFPNDYKFKSLEDNLYFTLKDIHLNILFPDYFTKSRQICDDLTNNINYDKRDDNFEYTKLLENENYRKELIKWLNTINKTDFDFEPIEEYRNYQINMNNFINFDVWWIQFDEMRNKINLLSS